ncbi:hypothetical protein [Bifidobacterium myosotis]|uniref:Uncharacterized protein n=1 Tax=Bifidobacterium myosotis TaxID=1630166 RepID=A0A5M9ZHW2_9BIFI|nr:hypothetical protein [Bifidobacterium myosotis]KAA8827211.1 hypothetical protein EMO91_09165 [Bifidobacterium myosotis]
MTDHTPVRCKACGQVKPRSAMRANGECPHCYYKRNPDIYERQKARARQYRLERKQEATRVREKTTYKRKVQPIDFRDESIRRFIDDCRKGDRQ